MKIIINKFYLLVFLILMLSCSKEETNFVISQEDNNIENIINAKLIDKDVNGNEIEVNTDYLKDKWEKELLQEGIDVVLEKFQILESFDDSNKNRIYFLKAVSIDGKVETGAFLDKGSKDDLYMLGRKTCTCQGCPNGCNLELDLSRCFCTPCPANDPQSCTKTETVVIEE